MGWGPVDWVDRVLPEAKFENKCTLFFYLCQFLDTQVSPAPTHVRMLVGWSVGHTFGFPISGRPSVKRKAYFSKVYFPKVYLS